MPTKSCAASRRHRCAARLPRRHRAIFAPNKPMSAFSVISSSRVTSVIDTPRQVGQETFVAPLWKTDVVGVATSRSLMLHCRNQSNPLFYAREPCDRTPSSHAATSVDAEVLTRLLCAGSQLRATGLRITPRLPPTVVAICTQTVPTPASTDLAIWLAQYRQAIDQQVAIGRGDLAIRPGLNSTRKSTSCKRVEG